MPSDSQLRAALDQADAIVHFGAGKCRELPLYLSGRADKSIFLIEANPRTANLLAGQNANHSNVTVLPYAVACEPGEHTLYVYNLWELSSLREPTGVYDLFPGLRIVRELPVEAVAPAQLLSEFGIQDCQSPFLVVDVPGEELSILKALRDEEYLGRFRCLLVHCGVGELYEGAGSGDSVLAFLQDQGYDQLAAWDDEDPDRPCWLFRANELRLENRELKFKLKELDGIASEQSLRLSGLEEDLKAKQRDYESELATIKRQKAELAKKAATEKTEFVERARQERAELEHEKNELIDALKLERSQLVDKNDELDALAKEQSKKLSKLEEQLKVAERESEFELAKVKQQQDDALEKAAAEKAEFEGKVRRDQAELEQAKSHLSEAKHRISRFEADLEASARQLRVLNSECAAQEKAWVSVYVQLDAVEADREALGAAASSAEESAANLTRERDSRAEEVVALRQNLQDAKSDLSVALRLQVLRETDLKDLQSRYSQVLNMKERQDDLLAKLRSRLGVASEYLQQLTAEGDPNADEGLPRDLVRSLVGKDD